VDRLQIDTDDFAVLSDNPSGDLEPAAGRGAKIDDRITGSQKTVTLLQFKQFVSGAGAITFLLGFLVEAVVRVVNHFCSLNQLLGRSDRFNLKKKPSLKVRLGLTPEINRGV
jgi:hypothetical protein